MGVKLIWSSANGDEVVTSPLTYVLKEMGEVGVDFLGRKVTRNCRFSNFNSREYYEIHLNSFGSFIEGRKLMIRDGLGLPVMERYPNLSPIEEVGYIGEGRVQGVPMSYIDYTKKQDGDYIFHIRSIRKAVEDLIDVEHRVEGSGFQEFSFEETIPYLKAMTDYVKSG